MSSAASMDAVCSGLRMKPMVMGLPSDPKGGRVGVDVGLGVTVCVAVDRISVVADGVTVGGGVFGAQAEANRMIMTMPSRLVWMNFLCVFLDLFIFISVQSRMNDHIWMLAGLVPVEFPLSTSFRVQGRD